MPPRKKRAAAGWCETNGVKPGDTIEALIYGQWFTVRVTGIGESAILARRKGAAEVAHQEPTKLRVREK